jgi:hypothetical protein
MFTIQALNNYGDYYKRTNVKFQSVIANISGILRLLQVIGGLITSYISSNMMFVDISNNIINYNNNDKEKNIELLNHISTSIQVNNLVIRPKQNVNNVRKSLSLAESILPAIVLRQDSAKRYMNKIKIIIKNRLSVDYMLKEFNDLEKLKQVSLNNSQLFMFNELRNMTLDEHFDKDKNINMRVEDQIRNIDESKYDNIEKRILNFYERKLNNLM